MTEDAAPRRFVARKRAALGCVAVAMGLFLTAAPAFAANSPWWSLSSASRPANIDPAYGQDEVQEITVPVEAEFEGHPEQGGLTLSVVGNSLGEFATEPTAAEIGFTALTAANLQVALEGAYGAGDVAVAATPAGPGHLGFTATARGARSGEALAPIVVEGVGLGEPRVMVTAVGRPDGELSLTAEDLGDAAVDGAKAPVRITDVLPPGLRALGIVASIPGPEGQVNAPVAIPCEAATLSCTLEAGLAPYDAIEVRVAVEVEAGAQSGQANEVKISGGGAPATTLRRPVAISAAPTPFAVEDYRLRAEEEGGGPATQAGSHPFQVTGTVAVNQLTDQYPLSNDFALAEPAALPKDLITKLPPGLLGNPTPFATCSLAQFLTTTSAGSAGVLQDACPAAAAVGVSSATVNERGLIGGAATFTQPVFNLETGPGEPARFGFFVGLAQVPVVLDTSLRSGRTESAAPGAAGPDYGVDVDATNISQTAGLTSARVTFWGVPGDPRHDNSRGWGCLGEARGETGHDPCTPSEEPQPPPLLSLPTSCSGTPLQTSVEADSWTGAGAFSDYLPSEPPVTLLGCNQLPFSPTTAAEPTSDAATSPTGLNFDLNVNDEGLANPKGLVQSQIKEAVVTLPEGFTANPSVAAGLGACSEAAYEASTDQPGTGCPEDSKIGEAEIESPLVKQKLHGSLFVATQHANPNHNLLTLYLVVQSPELGVLIKSAGEVTPNPLTGQLVTTFRDIPQVPFSHFRLSFRQGQRSPLITPPACGSYAVEAELYPWSNPTVALHDSSAFSITTGPEGLGCPSGGVPPFHPDLLAGSKNPTAGAYSPFNVRITRKDSEQEMTHFSIKLPPGVIGKLAGVPYCSDAQIAHAKSREHEGGATEEEAAPSCPAASSIGHTTVGTGVGTTLAYAGGKLYLAGPYHGSQLSLVSITDAKVGPFDLGTVVVRFALRIDPETAEVSVDGAKSDPIPHIIDGIPVHLRDIQAYVDRPNFTLNPTSCAKTSTAATVLGSGASFTSEADDQPVTVTSPYQVGNCASLGFAPKLALSVKGGTKRNDKPKFKAVLTYPKGGNYSNIKTAQVTLPASEFLEQSHLNDICTRVQFNAGGGNGEQCPKKSVYGRAVAVTPLLDQPLAGPVYLRSSSHKLPDLVAALHNGQINIDLDGRIDSVQQKGSEISRIRNSFELVPDAPVSKFTLELQGGNKSLLVNSTNICKGTHRATADFEGHNGKLHDFNPPLQAECGKKGKKKGKGHKKGAKKSSLGSSHR